MSTYGKELFKGTVPYYSKYRLTYPSSLIRFLIERFSLDGNGKLLDLGCGTGRLTLRFSDWFEQTVGIDLEAEMIEEATRLQKELRVENVQWFNGELEEYKERNNDKFRLVTIAKAFHWMEREKLLESLYEIIPVGGGIAIIDDYSPNKILQPWQQKVQEIVKQWYGSERKAGNSVYFHPKLSHEAIVESSKFSLEKHQVPPYTHHWTIESIIGNLYSTSFASKRLIGDHAEAFERHLTEELFSLNANGEFTEEISLSVILAIKNK